MAYRSGRGFSVFGERRLSDYLDARRRQLSEIVRREAPNYLLNVNDDEYVAHLVSESEVEPLHLHFEEITASQSEEMIPAEAFPSFLYNVQPGGRYPKQVFKFHIPVEGTEELLHLIPNTRLIWSEEVSVEDGNLCFSVVDLDGTGAKVKQEMEAMVDRLRRQLANVTVEVDAFNASLHSYATQQTQSRREELRKQQEVASSIGVPIRKADQIPSTFRVPTARSKVLPKPQAARVQQGQPEPTLGDDVYAEILEVVHQTGKVFERLPSTYAGKSEEDLRDHLILQLEPRFEGSTTGETFNKTGKTDILIRHEKSNLFVGECVWWDGASKLTAKLDQLLGYLTWRDSKTALVVFVGRQDFTATLAQIRNSVAAHPCYVRPLGEREETWFDVEFHLPGDPDRAIKLAVQAFHLPR